VPCIAVTYASELDEREAIIEHNRQRIKNGQQLYNEGKEIEIIEAERAAKRKQGRLLLGLILLVLKSIARVKS